MNQLEPSKVNFKSKIGKAVILMNHHVNEWNCIVSFWRSKKSWFNHYAVIRFPLKWLEMRIVPPSTIMSTLVWQIKLKTLLSSYDAGDLNDLFSGLCGSMVRTTGNSFLQIVSNKELVLVSGIEEMVDCACVKIPDFCQKILLTRSWFCYEGANIFRSVGWRVTPKTSPIP